MFLVSPDKLDIKRHLMVFYLACIISIFDGEKIAKQMKSRCSFCSNLLPSHMPYDVDR